MTLQEYTIKLKTALPPMIKELAQTLEPEFIPYIESNFNASKRTTKRNNTDRLFDNTPNGGLLSSFRTGQKDSLTAIKTSADGISAIFGSSKPYAAIHEFGGIIKYKTREGSTVMPERPYLRPAVKEFENKGFAIWLEEIVEKHLNNL